jgi:CheY-like chemotaxis protein
MLIQIHDNSSTRRTFKGGIMAVNPSAAAKESPVGKGTILLADDEKMALELGQIVLEGFGYRVLVAKDGEEAVSLYREHSGEVDLVILDIQMPRLDGPGALVQLKHIDPAVKVLAVTGSCPQVAADLMLSRGAGAVLHKPYQALELATAVQQMLLSRRTSAAGVGHDGKGI